MLIKRAFDFVLSFLLFIVFSPVFCLIGFLIKIFLGSPIIFKQKRPGLMGKPFYIFKFRTMLNKKDEKGNMLPDEERLTPLGSFLRKNSLDELPEVINVIKGDMSLVGPRPLKMEYLDLYSEGQFKRHYVRPGITGWAQINGRNLLDWEKRFELDVWYVENWSFWLDLKILLITFFKVLSREGISAEGHATMPEFKGKQKNK